MDFGWKFFLGDPASAQAPGFDDGGWRKVNVPHDWSVELPVAESNPSGTAGGFFAGGIGWYRKTFSIPPEWKNRTFGLEFDAIFRNSTIWLNGRPVGGRAYGYMPQHYDVSALVRTDSANVIAVRADASIQPYDRWYSGAGIIRNVRLNVKEAVHIPTWGTAVTTPGVTPEKAGVALAVRVNNNGTAAARSRLSTRILDPGGRTVARGRSTDGTVPAGGGETFSQTFSVKDPDLWSPGHPALYRTVSTVTVDGRETDVAETPFGIRTVRFSPDSGLILNGAKTVMKGVCIHHDGGCTGAAVPVRVWERRLEILKDLGVNAIRFAHNPHAPEVLDLCDRMGFLAFDEIYDKWAMPWQPLWAPSAKISPKAFAAEFHATWKRDLRDFIDRDRNHPSVVIWSVGNETIEQLRNPEKGVRILDSLVRFIHGYEPTRKVTCALHPGKASDGHEVPSRFMRSVDVVSYNYRTKDMADWHRLYPEVCWISAETKAYREDRPENWAETDYSNNSWFAVRPFDYAQGKPFDEAQGKPPSTKLGAGPSTGLGAGSPTTLGAGSRLRWGRPLDRARGELCGRAVYLGRHRLPRRVARLAGQGNPLGHSHDPGISQTLRIFHSEHIF